MSSYKGSKLFQFMYIPLVLAIVANGACGNNPYADLEVPIRDIEVLCPESSLNQCGFINSGKTVYIILSSSRDSDCSQVVYDAMIDSNTYAAIGSSTLYYDSQIAGLKATVSHWLAPGSLESVVNLPSSYYAACAYIDSNGNGVFDGLDAVGSPLDNAGGINISSIDNEVVDWRTPTAVAGF
jgi:hypothetical protein